MHVSCFKGMVIEIAKVSYNLYICKDCDIDFFTRKGNNCPKCADNALTECQRTIYMLCPVIYKRPWTEDDDSFLIDAVEQGIKNQEIADELDRTKDSVAERLRRLRKTQKIERGTNKCTKPLQLVKR